MKKIFKIIFILTLLLLTKSNAFANTGTIDNTDHTAKFRNTLYGNINFLPTQGDAIQITNSAITGDAWGDKVGWINFNPAQGGVTNNGSGVLGGYAWGQNTGWINFAPAQGGVSIVSYEFVGDAWSENYGWIQFDCNVGNACVKTDWKKNNNNPDPDPICNDNIDNDSDTFIDEQDPECHTDGDETNPLSYDPNGITETLVCPPGKHITTAPNGIQYCIYDLNVFECNDNVDNDGDNLTDEDDPVCHANQDLNDTYNPQGITESPKNCPVGQYLFGGSCVSINSDVCPNIAGVQTTVPAGKHVDSSGNCIDNIPANDSCPNISGIQNGIPVDMHLDLYGNCVYDGAVDFCPNIDNIQSSVPYGMHLDPYGNCIENDLNDSCPNIAGIQTSIPYGKEINEYGDCVDSVVVAGDVCPNISGVQQSVPSGKIINENGDCVDEITPPDNTCYIIDGEAPTLWQTINCMINETIDHTEDVIKDTIDKIKYVLANPAGNALTKSIAIVGLTFGTAFTLLPYLFSTPFSFSELVLMPYRLWSLFMSILGLRKRVRPWGTVYDSVTKQPLDPVVVDLFDGEGKKVQTSITDMDGRYGFLTEPGHYWMRPRKTHYAFPSFKLAGKTRDEIYLDLYFGNFFEVASGDEIITKNIPMDREGFDWNEFAKKNQKLMKFYSKRDIWLSRIADSLFSFGFFIAFIALVSSQSVYNIIIFILYLLMLVIRETGIKQKLFGRMQSADGSPLSYGVLKVYSTIGNIEVARKVANKYGKYYCLIQNGHYIVTIERKNADQSYTHIYTSETIEVTKGVINTHFKI